MRRIAARRANSVSTLAKARYSDHSALVNASVQHPSDSPELEPAATDANGGTAADFNARLRELRGKMQTSGHVPPTPEGWEAIARAIAGE